MRRSRKNPNRRAFLSLVRCPPLSRPPRHRFVSGKAQAFLPQRARSRASRGAQCSSWPSFASSTTLVLRLRCSLSEIYLGGKNKHRFNILSQPKTTLIDSSILSSTPHQEARQSPLMLPSCFDAHVTPSHENGDRVPSNPPSTRQNPPAPAMAPCSPALPGFGCTRTHTKQNKKRLSPASNRRRPRPSGSSERPGRGQRGNLSKMIYCCT